jgi:hypothetical protein
MVYRSSKGLASAGAQQSYRGTKTSRYGTKGIPRPPRNYRIFPSNRPAGRFPAGALAGKRFSLPRESGRPDGMRLVHCSRTTFR